MQLECSHSDSYLHLSLSWRRIFCDSPCLVTIVVGLTCWQYVKFCYYYRWFFGAVTGIWTRVVSLGSLHSTVSDYDALMSYQARLRPPTFLIEPFMFREIYWLSCSQLTLLRRSNWANAQIVVKEYQAKHKCYLYQKQEHYGIRRCHKCPKTTLMMTQE